MSETRYLISEAAKLAEVKSHVLRYWEEELHLPIGRNEMGHRYYTRWDIQVFLSIKELKKKGMKLIEIKELTPLLYPTKCEKYIEKTPCVSETPYASETLYASETSKELDEEKVPEAFYVILEKLVAHQLKGTGKEETRYKELDKAIRIHQQSRKMIAATVQSTPKQKKSNLIKKNKV